MSNIDITSKIAKIKKLAERTANISEKANAEAMLEKLLKKYDLDIDLLDEVIEEPTYHTWHYKNKWHKKLLHQIIWRTVGADTDVYKQRHQRQVTGCYCTSTQALEIELEFEFHCRMFDIELDDFVLAYVNANDLFVYVEEEELPELSEEEIKRKLKAAGIASNMEKHTRNLMIEDGSKNE